MSQLCPIYLIISIAKINYQRKHTLYKLNCQTRGNSGKCTRCIFRCTLEKLVSRNLRCRTNVETNLLKTTRVRMSQKGWNVVLTRVSTCHLFNLSVPGILRRVRAICRTERVLSNVFSEISTTRLLFPRLRRKLLFSGFLSFVVKYSLHIRVIMSTVCVLADRTYSSSNTFSITTGRGSWNARFNFSPVQLERQQRKNNQIQAN